MSSANVLFGFIFLLGPILTISSRSWIFAWVGIELSFLGIIPLLFLGNKYLSLTKEATLKYFCVQALGRAFIFIGGFVIFTQYEWSYQFWFGLGLCFKLGLFPGHFWVPRVVRSLEIVPAILLLSWQKIGPLALLVVCLESEIFLLDHRRIAYVIIFLGGIRAVVGGLIGNNIRNVRAIIGASSISHTGWAVIGAVSGSLWTYFSLYCFVLILRITFLWEGNRLRSISILSLSGLPPFILFVGKWNIISAAIIRGIEFKLLILPIFGTILRLIFYLKFFYSFYLNGDSPKSAWHALPLVFLNFRGLVYLALFFGDRK